MSAQSFDGLAEHYERLKDLEDTRSDAIDDFLPARGGTALDAGCGTGRATTLLAGRFDAVVAVDLSASMVGYARTHRPAANVEYRVGDLHDVRGAFDLVLSIATLHHVPDLAAALRHLRSLVAPAGRAVLADVIAPGIPAYRAAIRVAPRAFYRLGALRSLASDLRRRRPSALDRYRVATYRRWLDHLASDRFLTRTEFESSYASALPGAAFVHRPGVSVCVWDAAV